MKINEIKPLARDSKHRAIAANHGLLMNSDMVRAMAFMETVKSDCAPYLQEIDYALYNRMLYRGVIGTTKTYIAKTVRLEDREPKDINLDLHNQINEYFNENYGAPFRNSIHVTADEPQAWEYAYGGSDSGSVYIIFPVGKFDFLWSPKISDMLDAAMGHDLQRYGNVSNALRDQEKLKKYWERFKNEALATYQTTDLKSAIKSGNEVMIRCQEYYGLRETDSTTDKHWAAYEELIKS